MVQAGSALVGTSPRRYRAAAGNRKRDRKKGTQRTQLVFVTPSRSRTNLVRMPRTTRYAPGGFVYHALNRAVARLPLFEKDEDYRAFECVLALALEKHPTRLLSYCLMPNHWHLVMWPRKYGELTAFLRWLMRWHAHYHTSGTGHLYQGRFKSFSIEQDEHLYTVLRYVERNALRANLVKRAVDWRWSSLWRREHGDEVARSLLAPWPVPSRRIGQGMCRRRKPRRNWRRYGVR
jgi:putative transposase